MLENNVGKTCTKMFRGAHVYQLAAKELTESFEATLAETRNILEIHERLNMMQFLLISRDHAKILLRDGVVRILWYQTCLKNSLYMNKSGLIEITAN